MKFSTTDLIYDVADLNLMPVGEDQVGTKAENKDQCNEQYEPKLNKEVYYTSMEEKQSWGRPSAARMSF